MNLGINNYKNDLDSMFTSDDGQDNYDEFGWLDAVASVVKGGTDLAGKAVGSGKKGREAKANEQKNALRQKEIDAEIARTQAKQAAKDAKAKVARIVIISVLIFLLVGGGIVTWAVFIKKK